MLFLRGLSTIRNNTTTIRNNTTTIRNNTTTIRNNITTSRNNTTTSRNNIMLFFYYVGSFNVSIYLFCKMCSVDTVEILKHLLQNINSFVDHMFSEMFVLFCCTYIYY